MAPLDFSQFTIILLILLILIILFVIYEKNRTKIEKSKNDGLLEPPVPFKLPFIGHLHLMTGHKVPYQAFTDIGKKYGNVVKLQLGNVKCVVINDHQNIREAIINKTNHFDARPNFARYEHLFSGNKQNCEYFSIFSIPKISDNGCYIMRGLILLSRYILQKKHLLYSAL